MRIGARLARLGINDGTVRISVGLEDAEDIIADWCRRWAAIGQCRLRTLWVNAGRPSASRTASCELGGRCRSTFKGYVDRIPISSKPCARLRLCPPTARRARSEQFAA
jgi:hypothetical protein